MQDNEFSLIRTLFAPLTRGFPGSLELQDDAALIYPPEKHFIIVTADATISGVHFQDKDPPDLIARKLIRVNLSDLSAMGAKPWLMIAVFAFSAETEKKWICHFTNGLAEDEQLFNVSLIGGDTVTTPGVMTFALTAFGLTKVGCLLYRSGACPGDILYVTGTIGDGALGLMLLQKQLFLDSHISETVKYLHGRYYLPQPRITIGRALTGIAHACMDISDGILQDLSHLCQYSRVGARLFIEHLPVFPSATTVKRKSMLIEAVMTGGDDYELLFTAPPSARDILTDLVLSFGIPITPIGIIMTEDNGISVLGPGGEVVKFSRSGYQHLHNKL